MAVILRRLLRIGNLPADMRAEVEPEGILLLAEYVPVTFRFGGSVPGLVSKGSVRSYVGSLVLTSQRVLGTLSTVPKLAGRAIDQRWDAPQEGPVGAEISSTGIAVNVDVGQVDPAFTGQLSLHYKTAIPEPVLTTLPRRTLSFSVPREWVLRAVGVPAPRPA
ncbi:MULTISPECIES: hypothetical protein [unclassified Mycobacterium]|uniref:hypothetical protein n=1 Tax=unclassified Mycobacterium TaxID=2642494 RepID=UPI000800647B|nr:MULTISPECIES: hypothetical protein [unclassified Mycobacterium]OBG55541.1 hypothetical protein A5703_07670 [Mycobacterium sp. E188]OBH34342.1 hypothetical protein A5691_07995 [Mycobacterium sp. E183]